MSRLKWCHQNRLAARVIFPAIAAWWLAGCGQPAAETVPAGGFAGSAQCANCHEEEARQWQGSHHQQAMQLADAQSVLGDFQDVTVDDFAADVRLFRRDGAFFASLADGSGEVREFRVSHTFGVFPLQQYLVDAGRGRRQVLPVAWDSRPADVGGQRWYQPGPDGPVAPGDPLHWSGRYGNWNVMCAECHSTNVRLGYDRASDSFDTRYDEVSVGCEACHGPGAVHIGQARQTRFDADYGLVTLNDRKGAGWQISDETGIAVRSAPAAALAQPEACGRCHARRSVLAPVYAHGRPLTDTHMPALLDAPLYHADGRIRDEVYVYGSFLQSRMYRAGVTCTDCHNPHSGTLKAGPEPNDTCAQCHAPATFARNHAGAETTTDCVSCHMPATTYMGIDDRRDHSFRLPGTSVAADHYGRIIAAGRRGDADTLLLDGIANTDYPPIARATMLTLLGDVSSERATNLLRVQFASDDPLLRYAALRALAGAPASVRLASGGGELLLDPILAVRVQAAATFAAVREALPLALTDAFLRAATEYREALLASAAMPEAALSVADFESVLGNREAAADLYAHALRVGPDFAPAHYAMALQSVRIGARPRALGYLERAAELAPGQPHYAYAHGVALNSLGQQERAISVLRDARVRFPADFDIGWALATIYRDRGDRQLARAVLLDLQQQFPARREPAALLEALGR